MKSIYLKAGTTQDVFNDLKDNFNGTLISNNNEFDLAIDTEYVRGNIKGASLDGITFMQFEMIFHDDVRLTMETLKTSPIFFAYCAQGSIQHSFGENGMRKTIKKQQTGILKSTSSVNTILHFEKNTPVKWSVIQVGINSAIAIKNNSELVKKIKNTFYDIKEDYLAISPLNLKIAEKIEAFNAVTGNYLVRNKLKSSLIKEILEMEIEQNTDGFSVIARGISSFAIQQIDKVKKVSDYIVDLSLEVFTTAFLIEKARLSTFKLQKEFKNLSSRSVHDFLLFIRVGERI